MPRTERFFVEFIGPSINAVMGAKSKKTRKWLGVGLYIGAKKAIGNAMVAAGVKHIEPFTKPVELWFFPQVAAGASGHISKAFDCLNFGISYKIIEDWLVKFGKIRDDNRDCVHGAHSMRSEIAPDGLVGIWVVACEVENAAPLGFQDDLGLVEPPPF